MRTMEKEPVITPRPMRRHSPSLLRRLIWTLRRIRIGKAERKKSEMADMTVKYEFVYWRPQRYTYELER